MLSNLAVVLETRFGRDGNLTDINQAIDAERQAIALLPADSPAHCELASNLSAAGSATTPTIA